MSTSLWHAPLDEFRENLAAAQPAPAGVAASCVAATLGISLLMKVLRITGRRPDLLPLAERLANELRVAADADVEAVWAYIQARDAVGLHEVPARALRAAREALELSTETEPHIAGLIAADVRAAAALLQGSVQAIEACIAANQA